MFPRQSSTTHTEFLGDEASVYDWAQGKVHALNPTAASVWRRCDGATTADEIAVAVHRELGIPDTDAVVDLTLKEFAGLHLLEQPVESLVRHAAPTRRRLLERGLTAAMLPAVYTILTPSALEAQSPGGAPTLISVAPIQGTQGTTIAVTLTGTNFVAPATVAVSGAGVTVSPVVVVGPTSLTTSFVIDAAAAVGGRTVTVTTPGGTTGTQPFTITAPSPVVPTLTSVAPNQGTQGATVAVTLTGTNFVGPATVVVSGAGVTVGAVVVVNPTSLTTSFVIDPAAAVGARTVTVTTPGGTTGTQPFTITAPSPVVPTLTSVAPNQGTQGATVAVTLTGTNFVAPATVAVSGAGVTAGAVVVVGPTSLTTSFVIDAAAAVGGRTVTVTTPGGTTGTQPFTITAPAPGVPTLTSVVPIQGAQGATVAVTLTGTNFVAPATVAVSGAGVTVGAVVVVGPTSLTTSFVIDPAAAVGARTVTVTTPGGTTGTQPFTITAPAPGVPTLTSVVPIQGAQGATVAVTLTGTNFVAPATVAVSGAGVTAGAVVVVGPTSLTTSFVIDAAAAVGARTVTVTTPGGTTGTQPFTITAPAPGVPTLTSVVPIQGAQGATVAVTLTGTNFVAPATVAVSGAGVTVGAVVVGGPTSLTTSFVIDAAAAVGARTVTVTTPGGTTGTQPFTIIAPPPTLTVMNPVTGVRGTQVSIVVLVGSGFITGGTTVNFGAGVTVDFTQVQSDAIVAVAITILATASVGPRPVTVTTINGTSNALDFTITAPLPPPTLGFMDPVTGARGAVLVVTLVGTGFVSGLGGTTANFGAGVTVGLVLVGNATSLATQISIAFGAAIGPRSVTVMTANGTSNALTFNVT